MAPPAPQADIIAGTVLLDPMSLFLHAADLPRNFFRTRCRTASELFFRYFALERGISHYLSRHLRWTDSLLLAAAGGAEGPAPAPLPERVVRAIVPRCAQDPLEPPFDVPNYAPFVTPCPAGPLVRLFAGALIFSLPPFFYRNWAGVPYSSGY